MALGILKIFYILIIVSIISCQILLYKPNTKVRNEGLYFILNVVLVFLLSYIVYTSLPSNFAIQKVLTLVWSALATLAFLVRINVNKSLIVSKLMLTVALIGNLVQLLI